VCAHTYRQLQRRQLLGWNRKIRSQSALSIAAKATLELQKLSKNKLDHHLIEWFGIVIV